MASELMKWTKRLVIFVVIIFMFEFFLFEIDIKNQMMVVISRRDFSMNDKKMISSLDQSVKKSLTVPSSNSLMKDTKIHSRPNTSNKVTSITKSMKKSIMGMKSVIYKVLMEKKEDKELKKPDCIRNNTSRAGRVAVNLSAEKMKTIENLFASTVSPGGRYSPPGCKSSQRIAVIIPYRDRENHLKLFLRHMHPFLQRQQLEYAIFVIEMGKKLRFNRAMLMNVGFIESMKLHNYTCFVFHDVDLLPEDDRIPYSCASMPQHLSVAVDKFNYRLPYEAIFGGACSIRTEHFRKINGMSNMFFGWGGEDDDLRMRVLLNGLRIVRPPVPIARYKMIKHTTDHDKNPKRRCLLRSIQQRMSRDGLSNIKYSVEQLELRPLYTWVLVTVNETQQIQSDEFLFTLYKRCAGINKNDLKNMDRKHFQGLAIQNKSDSKKNMHLNLVQ